MFYLFHHHDMQRLAELLAELRARNTAVSPLKPDTIVVPNHGLARWLRMQLAESEGVAANLQMPLPARFFWQLMAHSLDEDRAADSSAYVREHLVWHLYALLPEMAPDIPAVAQYLDGEAAELRRLQLAERLADVFDQYLIYRREMLLAWEDGEIAPAAPENWQAMVWRVLVDRLGPRHRARLLGEFIARIERDEPLNRARWPQHLYCFGLGNLPPDYLRLLYALGKARDVFFLLQNPSREYWGEIVARPISLRLPVGQDLPPAEAALEQSHPLLASLGRAGRDFLRLLYSEELSAIHEPELGEAMAYEPSGEQTLLGRIQSGLIRMQVDSDPPPRAEDDVSLQVHACHGPLREVQVLHDQLLDLLAGDASLQPRDILVMMPRVGDYAPAIHAVFGAARDPARIPFNVSDRPRLGSHPVTLTVRQLLELPLSRWKASEIMALAGVPAVMRRYGLDESDLDNLRHWVSEAGVRWGLDARTRVESGAGDWHQNSWQFGLDRLLVGVAQADGDTLVDGVAPWTELEGGGTAALGRLWLLLERLRRWRDLMSEPATAGQWQERLNRMLAELFAPDPEDRDEQAALASVSEAVAVLGTAADCINEQPLSWEAVREVLLRELEDSGERQPFLAGGVSFCGLVPLRAVPFRVVCILGLNDGDFPRQPRQRSFNLIHRQPRPGDASVRDDDRHLFLQALMAARDVFYLSYTGQDVRGGEELAPSPVVSELLDFIRRDHLPRVEQAPPAREALITKQPMQPFSPRYFPEDRSSSRIFTFNGAWFAASEAMGSERAEARPLVDDSRAPAPRQNELALTELQRFLAHPARHFLGEILQLALDPAQARLEDEEPRALDFFTAAKLRRELLARAQSEDAIPATPPAYIKARGILPPPPLDQTPWQEQTEQVRRLQPVRALWYDDEMPGPRDVDLLLPCGLRLMGRIADVYVDGLRRLQPGKIGPQYRLQHWVDYLALRAGGTDGVLRCCGLEQGEPVFFEAELTAAAARDYLNTLAELWLEGQQRPLCFLPRLAGEFMQHQHAAWTSKPKSAREALEARNGYLANSYRPAWEMHDPWFRRLVRPPDYLGQSPGDSDFCDLAQKICGPLVAHLQPVSDPLAAAEEDSE